MGHNITLFSGYNQSENRTTNYCLLILKMLYEENPKFLAEFLNNLGGENFGENVGVKFLQQEKKKWSIPDGVIIQKSFSIYIETKNFNWFYDDQLENHLRALGEEEIKEKILIALGRFENDNYKNEFQNVKNICKTKFKEEIKFEAVSFEDFVDALDKLSDIPKNLKDNLEDFKLYLDESDLLPRWKNYLDVVNCAGIPEDVLDGNVYLCPATGGAYNHGRSKYFGMYRNKMVEKVAEIKGIVDILSPEEAVLLWKNTSEDDCDIKTIAMEKLNIWRPKTYPTRVFVLGDLFETTFMKDSSGGMWGSKKYFDISGLGIKNAQELSIVLKEKKWSDLF